MNVDVKILREAARLMRERADSATRGPWIAHPDGLVWPGPDIPGDPVSGSTQIEDARHIASWHPLVALAVAAWVDAHATDLASANGDRGQTDSPGDMDMALKVARAYLAGEWS